MGGAVLAVLDLLSFKKHEITIYKILVSVTKMANKNLQIFTFSDKMMVQRREQTDVKYLSLLEPLFCLRESDGYCITPH